jgi:prepilin-type N-terminal cleavage/methylation domain-containing protein
MEKMRNHKGLTIFEILVVIGILAIVSAFVVPNIIGWRSDMKLTGAINNLKGDLEMAKARAIRENNFVAVSFSNKGYTIFIDNGAGGVDAGDWLKQGSELLLRDREMPSGVTVDLAGTTFANKRTRFNGRGHCAVLGSAVLKNDKGESKTIAVSRLRININKGS